MAFLGCTTENLHRFMPGYAQLGPEERERINEFSLVWQMFEARLFGNRANASKIKRTDWFEGYADDICHAAGESIEYFRERYFLAHDANPRLEALIAGLAGDNVRPSILAGLREGANSTKKVVGCGAICFRLRNNLFHGTKANDGFAGQLNNFTHGIRFLNACLSVHP